MTRVTLQTGPGAVPMLGFAIMVKRLADGLIYLVPAALLTLLDLSALHKPLWSDEWATSLFSGQSWPDLWHSTSHVDRDLLPYYSLVHLARDGGAGIVDLRILSLVAAVVAVIATQVVARTIWGRVAALATGCAVALNPLVCLWASQARPTALAYAATALSTLAIVRWGRLSPVLYPALITLGTLLFPPVSLAVLPHLVWRWRAAGIRAALKVAATAVPGVLLVAGWELLWVHQVSELVVASDARPSAAWLALSHGVGAVHGLPWLHVVAALAAIAALLAHRGPEHTMARRGLVLALLLAEGTLALAWLATVAGVPMLADNLAACIPIGAALLLGGLVGHDWFVPRNTDADVGIALRGGIAAAMVLTLTLAAFWWVPRGDRSVSIDGLASVAQTLASAAKVGDPVMIQQPYSTTGYTASLAANAGDSAFVSELDRELPHGARHLMFRRITRLDPAEPKVISTAIAPTHDASRLWVIRLPKDPVDPAYLTALRCTDPTYQHAQVIQTYVDLYTCPKAATAPNAG